MNPIHEVKNMPPEAVELFEAAGYMDVDTIFDNKISDITTELVKANNVLNIIEATPTREMVMQWLRPVEAEMGKSIEDEQLKVDPSMLIDPDEIENKPPPIPISKEYIQKHSIDLADLPEGQLRFKKKENSTSPINNKETESLGDNVSSNQLPENRIEQAGNDNPVLFNKATSPKQESKTLDMDRVLKMETFQKEGGRVAPIPQSKEINLTKTTSEETNKNVDPKSKFYVKGVLHKDIPKFKSGCRWFIIVNIFVFLSFALTSLVLVDKEKYRWAIWAPLLAIVSIIIFFSLAQKSGCPICNQKQFAPKMCRKHKSAHHWPVFGYMLPTALHALLFKWFRCIFCGTSVRLKK